MSPFEEHFGYVTRDIVGYIVETFHQLLQQSQLYPSDRIILHFIRVDHLRRHIGTPVLHWV